MNTNYLKKLSIFIINIITLLYIYNKLNKYNSTQMNKNKYKYSFMIKSFITLVKHW